MSSALASFAKKNTLPVACIPIFCKTIFEEIGPYKALTCRTHANPIVFRFKSKTFRIKSVCYHWPEPVKECNNCIRDNWQPFSFTAKTGNNFSFNFPVDAFIFSDFILENIDESHVKMDVARNWEIIFHAIQLSTSFTFTNSSLSSAVILWKKCLFLGVLIFCRKLQK